jgi:hypothetical protein
LGLRTNLETRKLLKLRTKLKAAQTKSNVS